MRTVWGIENEKLRFYSVGGNEILESHLGVKPLQRLFKDWLKEISERKVCFLYNLTDEG